MSQKKCLLIYCNKVATLVRLDAATCLNKDSKKKKNCNSNLGGRCNGLMVSVLDFED